MILRLWSGFTDTPEKTAAYDHVLDTEVAPGIVGRRLPGLQRFEVWTRLDDEVDGAEHLTAMWFDDLDAVAAFTGGDHHDSVVPPRARAELARFDDHSRHYRLRRRHLPER